MVSFLAELHGGQPDLRSTLTLANNFFIFQRRKRKILDFV